MNLLPLDPGFAADRRTDLDANATGAAPGWFTTPAPVGPGGASRAGAWTGAFRAPLAHTSTGGR
jgi:hypothetical protein